MGVPVFVGNIAYELTEEQMTQIFSQVGRVLNFKIMMDRDSGKPKGYGFCEFEDMETAKSAIRNMNNFVVGGRNLRVDFTDEHRPQSVTSANSAPTMNQPASYQAYQYPTQTQASAPYYPQPQAAAPATNGQPQTDAIAHILQTINHNQLWDILAQMKSWVQTDYEQAKSSLIQNPQLTFAIFQILILLKAITPQTVQKVTQSMMQQQYSGYYAQQYYPYAQTAGQAYPQYMGQQSMPYMPTAAGSTGAGFSAQQLQEQQKQALMQIMNLTDEQIQALPPQQQQQIKMLKQHLQQQQQ